MRNRLLVLAAVTACVLAACDTASGSSSAGQHVVVQMIGDTTVVRTLSGSVWEGEATLVPEISIGELDGPEELLFGWVRSIAVDADHNVYAFDDQAQEVRVFDSAGQYVETLGGRGEGPGEFSRAEAIATLPDGRLVVRDPGNSGLEVFVPGTSETERWRYDVGNLFSLRPLHTDASGRTYLHTRDLSRDGFAMHVIVFGPDGAQIDTLPEPSTTYEPPEVTAEMGPSSVSYYVPFSPELHWTVHPGGHFLSGLSTDYRIDPRPRRRRTPDRARRRSGAGQRRRACPPTRERCTARAGLRPGLDLERPPDPRSQAVLPRHRGRPRRPHLGEGPDGGARSREPGPRPGGPRFHADALASAGALRRLRGRRELPGGRERPGGVRDLHRSGLRRGPRLGRDPRRSGGGAGGAVQDCGGGLRGSSSFATPA